MGDHSLLAPSSASIWSACPGSVQMCLGLKKRDNEAAKEGDVVHYLAARFIKVVTKGWQPGRESSKVLDTVIDGVLVTKEMIDAALLYAKRVEKAMQYYRVFGGDNLAIEEKLTCSKIHPMCFGTPDCWLYSASDDILHLWDLKYGFGVVDVFENPQMLCYLAGIIERLNLYPSEIFVTIVQPRAPHKEGPVRTWHIKHATDLDNYFDGLNTAAERAMGPSPELVTGPHCRYCDALVDCGANRDNCFNAIDTTERIGKSKVKEDNKWYELFILQTIAERIKHRITALEIEITESIKRGKQVPRYQLEHSYGRNNWMIPFEEVIKLGESVGIDLNAKKPLTPRQAINAGMDENLIKMVSQKKQTGSKLKFDDLKQARYVFGHNERS